MKLIILGSGGYGKTVADVAEQLGYTIQFIVAQLSRQKSKIFIMN